MDVKSPKTPRYTTRRSRCISHVPDSVKRNLNSSFNEQQENTSPHLNKKLEKDLTIVINQKSRTCRYKNYYYESVSESSSDSDDPGKLIINGKRKIKAPTKFTSEEFLSPVKSPRKNRKQQDVFPADDSETERETPQKNTRLHGTPKSKTKAAKTPRTPRTPMLQKIVNKDLYSVKNISTPKTDSPRLIIKLMKSGQITPSMPIREKPVEYNTTPLSEARRHLQVSYVPTHLPCREKEYSEVLSFLKGKLQDQTGGCIYISGVPGTGKTATVTAVINYLLQLSKSGDIKKFEYVSVNGMKLTEPRQAYVEILKQLSGKTLAWEQAQNMLNDKFTKKSTKKQLPIILLIDELDILCTKRQDVVYNLLDWPTKAHNQLIVITIANTMDLPERMLMNRVTSRLGLTRLTFQAYTHKQLQEIVTRRLLGTDSFNSDAIQLVARKVASVSGDARRALDICRKAAEVAENEGDDTMVTIHHVNEALKMMMTHPKVQAIKHCSRLEQYVLQAVVAEMERTGIEETGFGEVYRTLMSLLTLNGLGRASCTAVLMAIARLNSCRLLIVDSKCSDLVQRIILNVSPDDVFYALKEE